MKYNRLWLVMVFLLSVFAFRVVAQQTKPDLAKHEQKVRDMVAFLEYVLNTLGNSSTSARDKDVLIKESYTKIFRDAKVQIEDDLDENRNVITNKDVQAYLKDVDFFFDDVSFEFTVKDIKGEVNANGELFYKVSIARNLKGTTVGGKQINKTIPRYIEINYNPEDQDLKIVSIYTNEFDEKEALLNWWKQLSFEWHSVFKKKLNIISDSLQLDDIKNITSIDALDLSNNGYLRTIEPLAQLTNLKTLNLAGTTITDLSPIRNLTELVDLNIANSGIEDISALKYSDKLIDLTLNNTPVSDISVVEKMPALQHLEIGGTDVVTLEPLRTLTEVRNLNVQATHISDLVPLELLSNLTELNVSKTLIRELEPLTGLKELRILNLDSTYFADVRALGNLQNLRVLSMNYTSVSNLRPLQDLAHLERIYCDHTGIGRTLADGFMASRPGLLVIFDSEDLRTWWGTLTAEWRNVLSEAAKVGLQPTKEELAKVTNLDSINFAGNIAIQNIEPLRRLLKLKVVVAGKTTIDDLSPIKGHKEIVRLDISDTRVEDISVIKNFANLTVLKAANSKIQNIDPLSSLTGLKKLYVDETAIHELHVQEFLSKNPDCLVVYKTRHLENWWDELPASWREVFQTQIPMETKSRMENLHQLIELKALHFSNAPVDDLSPLKEFVRLKELQFSGTAIADISPLASITSLISLHVTNSPVRDIEPLNQLANLEDLDISNTPVDDLRALSGLQNLKNLNCSGTQIKRLDPLEGLRLLENVDCSNTSVRKLDPITGLGLKMLKCYNTSVSERRVEDFRDVNPDCNVVYYR
jgi:Leucine-rich repeat (LRR) protein